MAILNDIVTGYPTDRGGEWKQVDSGTSTDGVFTVSDSGGQKWQLTYASREPYYARYAGCHGVGDKTSLLQTALNNASISKVVIDTVFDVNGTLTIPSGKVIEFVKQGRLTGSGTVTGSGSYSASERQNCFGSSLTITGILPENNTVSPAHFGAAIDNSTDDGPAINRMFRYMETLSRQFPTCVFPAGRYVVNTTVDIPGNLNTSNGITPIIIAGYGTEISTTSDIVIFRRLPPDQSTALSTWINSYMGIIQGFRFIGNSTVAAPQTNQKALYIGAIYNWRISDIRCSAFHIGMQFEFALKCSFTNLNISSFSLDGFVGTYGGSWGGSATNSAFNANRIESVRWFCVTNSQSGLHLRGMDQTVVRDCVVEGVAPATANYWLEDAGSTGVNINTFDHCWNEGVSTSFLATNFKLGSRGITRIIGCQRIYPDVYVDATGYDVGEIVVDSIPYLGNIPTGSDSMFIKSAGSGTSYKFLNVGSGTVVTTAANWDSDTLPGYLFVESKSSTTWSLQTGNVLELNGGVNGTTAGNRRVQINGQMIAATDDTYTWGARGTTSTGSSQIRPIGVIVGTYGVSVDPAGKYRFKDTSGVTDVALSRDAAGVLELEATGAFLTAKGTTAQRPGTGVAGHTRYNSDNGMLEDYNGSIWQPVGHKIAKQTLTTTGSSTIATGETVYEIHLVSDASITIDIGSSAAASDIADNVDLVSGVPFIQVYRRTAAGGSFSIHYTYVTGTGNISVTLVKTIL